MGALDITKLELRGFLRRCWAGDRIGLDGGRLDERLPTSCPVLLAGRRVFSLFLAALYAILCYLILYLGDRERPVFAGLLWLLVVGLFPFLS